MSSRLTRSVTGVVALVLAALSTGSVVGWLLAAAGVVIAGVGAIVDLSSSPVLVCGCFLGNLAAANVHSTVVFAMSVFGLAAHLSVVNAPDTNVRDGARAALIGLVLAALASLCTTVRITSSVLADIAMGGAAAVGVYLVQGWARELTSDGETEPVPHGGSGPKLREERR